MVTWHVGDVDYEVAHSDRGGQSIYHLNLLKLWNEEHPVLLATTVIEVSWGRRSKKQHRSRRFIHRAILLHPAGPHRPHRTPH